MKDLKGKTIDVYVEGINAKISGLVINQDEDEITLQTKEDGLYNIPLNKIGPYKVVGEKSLDEIFNNGKHPLYIYSCKNDELSCKGVKMLSTNDNMNFKEVPCKCNKKKLGCEFGKLGNVWKLPTEILVAFLNNMCTQTFPVEEELLKGKEKK